VASSHDSVSQSLELNASGGIGCVAKVSVRGGWAPAELPATATPVDSTASRDTGWTHCCPRGVDGVVAWRCPGRSGRYLMRIARGATVQRP
jgi:hypothetical protein